MKKIAQNLKIFVSLKISVLKGLKEIGLGNSFGMPIKRNKIFGFGFLNIRKLRSQVKKIRFFQCYRRKSLSSFKNSWITLRILWFLEEEKKNLIKTFGIYFFLTGLKKIKIRGKNAVFDFLGKKFLKTPFSDSRALKRNFNEK